LPPYKLQVRAALRLRDVYVTRAAQALEQALLRRLADYHLVLERTRASLRQAVAANTPVNAFTVCRDLHGLVRAVQRAAAQLTQELATPVVEIPDLRTLLAELRQVEDEFGACHLDFKQKLLSVETDAIELEDVYLGPFSIQLSWTRLAHDAGSRCLEIVALDPQPAPTNEAVTHPHVRDNTLCAGDAAVPLQRALEQGRLADAFCLVRSVLTHYNPASPHVPLAEWGGQTCYECGCCVGDDDASHCEGCSSCFCEDCMSRCSGCGANRCSQCLENCPLCEEPCCCRCRRRSTHSDKICCRSCLRRCARCAAAVAAAELDPHTQLCPACLYAAAAAREPAPPAPLATGALPAAPPTPPETIHEPTNALGSC
jgi:hypothetical protein